MKVEYTPTVDDVLALKRTLQASVRRHPALYSLAGGPVAVAIGAALMALAGHPLWWSLTLFGLALSGLTLAAWRKNGITRAQVEREFDTLAWLRTTYRVEADETGLRYEHGPYRARAAWETFREVLETDDHFVLMERRAPGALAYGLAKRELAKSGGVATWRDHLSAHVRTAGGRVRTRPA